MSFLCKFILKKSCNGSGTSFCIYTCVLQRSIALHVENEHKLHIISLHLPLCFYFEGVIFSKIRKSTLLKRLKYGKNEKKQMCNLNCNHNIVGVFDLRCIK